MEKFNYKKLGFYDTIVDFDGIYNRNPEKFIDNLIKKLNARVGYIHSENWYIKSYGKITLPLEFDAEPPYDWMGKKAELEVVLDHFATGYQFFIKDNTKGWNSCIVFKDKKVYESNFSYMKELILTKFKTDHPHYVS